MREVKPSSCEPSKGNEELIRQCHRQLVSSVSRPGVSARMPSEHWLLSLRPVSNRVKVKECALDLWTRQELAKLTAARKEVKTECLSLGAERDSVIPCRLTRINEEEEAETLNEMLWESSEDLAHHLPKFSSCTTKSSENLIDCSSKTILSCSEDSEVNNVSIGQYHASIHNECSVCSAEAANDGVSNKNENKGSYAPLSKVAISRSKNKSQLMEEVKELEIGCNANNVYGENTGFLETRFQSSVDAPVASDMSLGGEEGDSPSVSAACPTNGMIDRRTAEEKGGGDEAGEPDDQLLEGETELPHTGVSFAKIRTHQPTDGSDIASESKPALNANLAAQKSNQRLVKRLGSLTKTPPLLPGWGFRPHAAPENRPRSAGFPLPKAESDIITGAKPSKPDLQTKAASDVVVSKVLTHTDSKACQVNKKKKSDKRIARKAPSSHMRPFKEGPRSSELFGRKQSRDVQAAGSRSKSNKVTPAGGQVLVVDYRKGSSSDKDSPTKAIEESQKSKMRKALLGVYEYDLSGHRQSRIVISQRQPKKTSSKEDDDVERPRARRTRRITSRTVAASPSVIANLWRQVDKSRLRRRKEHQGSFRGRSLPRNVGDGRAVKSIDLSTETLNQKTLPSMEEVSCRNLKTSGFAPHQWSPEAVPETSEEGEADGISFMDKSKSRSLSACQQSSSRCRLTLNTCPDGEEMASHGQYARCASKGQQKMDDLRTSTIYLSVRPRDRVLHLSPPRVLEKQKEVKIPKALPALPVNQVWIQRTHSQSKAAVKTWQATQAASASIQKKRLFDQDTDANVSMNRKTSRRRSGSRVSSAKKPMGRASSATSAADGRRMTEGVCAEALAECRLVTQRCQHLRSQLSSRASCMSPSPPRQKRPRIRSKSKRLRKGRKSIKQAASIQGKNVNGCAGSRPATTKARVGNRKGRNLPRGKKAHLGSTNQPTLPRNSEKSRLASGDDARLASLVSTTHEKQRRPGPLAELSLPDKNIASASDTDLKKRASGSRLSPALPTHHVTNPTRDVGDKTLSSLSVASDTIDSTTTMPSRRCWSRRRDIGVSR
ncbi:hypothetical protein ElyMa_005194700 [Elysia marginata]|uniref:Uncharacterized protein n=1 Tax=Elysia marginata TaxID=1093978 RepID=A0AAV4JSX4_9GAST|nr:hypothetical protein ElyMa_005194700 [Elysia marginata]